MARSGNHRRGLWLECQLAKFGVQCRLLAAECGQAQQDAGTRVNDGHGWGGKLLSGHIVPAETPGPSVSRTGRDLIAAAAYPVPGTLV